MTMILLQQMGDFGGEVAVVVNADEGVV